MNPPIERHWTEDWIEEFALIQSLSGIERSQRLNEFRQRMARLNAHNYDQLWKALQARFTPSDEHPPEPK